METTDFNGRKILVVGLGVSGYAAADLLARKGADVRVTEDSDAPEIRERASKLSSWRVKAELGGHTEKFCTGADLVVASPGISEDALPLSFARKEKVPVIGELELGFLLCRGRVIAITGTNGKSTTTELIGKILSDSGAHVVVCGNIGNPLSGEVDTITEETIVVVEVSSFQLTRTKTFKPSIAILLNVTEDHYDRHGNFDSYKKDKFRIFENQTDDDCAVLNFSFRDDPLVSKIKSRIVFFGSRGAEATFGDEGISIFTRATEEIVISKEESPIKGRHNLENAACATLVADIVGVKLSSVRKSIMDFAGLAHRFESVGVIGGVEFIDDSKATNIDATKRAIESTDKRIVLIAGGRDKGGDYSSVLSVVKQKVKAIVLVGEASDKIKSVFQGVISVSQADDMSDAVRKAYKEASEGEVVMLSPMCSSFDMFTSYKERGDVFQKEVRSLEA